MGGNSGRKVKSARATSRPAKPVKRPGVRNRKDREDYFTQPIEQRLQDLTERLKDLTDET